MSGLNGLELVAVAVVLGAVLGLVAGVAYRWLAGGDR